MDAALKKVDLGVNREEYLRAAYCVMRQLLLPEAPEVVPPISWGFPLGRLTFPGRNKTIGQIFQGGGARCEEKRAILISPTIRDGIVRILGVLLHEMVHAALPLGTGHRSPFQKLAARVGLLAPWTATTESETLKKTIREQVIPRVEKIVGGEWPEGHLVVVPHDRCRIHKAVCECRPPRIIRVSERTFEMGDIVCSECGEPFTM